jgi:hypothetical protein
MKNALVLLCLSAAAAAQPPVLAKLDHVQLVVRNHKACSDTLAELGFRLPAHQHTNDGSEQSASFFADRSYLELITPSADLNDRLNKPRVAFVRRREGLYFAALEVEPLEPAIPRLRSAGMLVSDVVKGSYLSTHVEPWWPDALPVWFLQYLAHRDRDERQDNGATAIAAVTLVVRDPAAELPQIAAFATVDAKEHEFATIGAIGSVAAIPRGGAIRIVTPKSADGIAGTFLHAQGEGLMSVTFRVNDVAALAKYLADRRVPFEREGESLVVASARGCSARMEFVE